MSAADPSGDVVRIVLRPLANPLPLGFLALAAATPLVSGLQLDWLEPAEGHHVALMLAASAAMLIPALIAAGGKLVAAAVLGTTALRFLVTALYEQTASGDWKTTAGVVGVILGTLALYAALSMALEDAGRHTVLPTLRHGAGAAAMTGDLRAQLDSAQHEAGVRKQL